MNIVYAMTHHVYDWILPSLRSLKATNPDAKVYILAEDDKLPIALPMPATVINVRDQQWFPPNGPNYNCSFKYINLVKVRYPTILKDLDKVIHLDIDTIICDRLDEMWNIDLEGKWFAMCAEERQTFYRPFGPDYYNAGIMVLNLKQMRNDGIEQPMQDYLNTVEGPWADQDAWNKFGIENGKIVRMPLRWNENMSTGTTDNPGIVHFCGIKNWFTRFNMPRIAYLNAYRKE